MMVFERAVTATMTSLMGADPIIATPGRPDPDAPDPLDAPDPVTVED